MGHGEDEKSVTVSQKAVTEIHIATVTYCGHMKLSLVFV